MTELNRSKSVVDAFDLSAVTRRFAEGAGIRIEKAKEYELELKRYLVLCYAQKRRYGMMGDVDRYWHEFIIHTKLYEDFCQQAFGGYVHHNPTSDETKTSPEQNLMYIRFLVDYFRYYGCVPPKDIWPFSYELFGEAADWQIIQAQCVADCFKRCNN